MAHFWVNGIVAVRDGEPYIQLSNEKGMIAQLTMGEARQIALDILVQSARTEMDAMLVSWLVKDMDAPTEAAAAAMAHFRDFRAAADQEKVERTSDGSEAGEG